MGIVWLETPFFRVGGNGFFWLRNPLFGFSTPVQGGRIRKRNPWRVHLPEACWSVLLLDRPYRSNTLHSACIVTHPAEAIENFRRSRLCATAHAYHHSEVRKRVVSKRVVLADVPRYQEPEWRYIRMFPGSKNGNEGTFGWVHSPKPPFYFPLESWAKRHHAFTYHINKQSFTETALLGTLSTSEREALDKHGILPRSHYARGRICVCVCTMCPTMSGSSRLLPYCLCVDWCHIGFTMEVLWGIFSPCASSITISRVKLADPIHGKRGCTTAAGSHLTFARSWIQIKFLP